MDGDDSINEDEWVGLKQRFSREEVEWDQLKWNTRTLQVWRWLVDADANLKASRHITDKLRRQHQEEKDQLEAYSEHLKNKCEDRVHDLEIEVTQLKDDLEVLLSSTQAVATMLTKEGLHDIAQSSLGEQIAYLLVERSTLNEELQSAKLNPSTDREKDLTSQLIKVSTEKELLKRSEAELNSAVLELQKRLSLLEKAMRQLEDNNETLRFKLSEALAEIDQKEAELRNYLRRDGGSNNLLGVDDHYSGPKSLQFNPSLSLDNINSNDTNQQNGTLSNGNHENEDDENRNMSIPGITVSKPSRNNSIIGDSHKFKDDLQKLRKELLKTGDRYEEVVKKYNSNKIKRRIQMESLKLEYKSSLEVLQRKINDSEVHLKMIETQLEDEKKLRDQMKQDLSQMRAERQDMVQRLNDSERVARDFIQEKELFQTKIKLAQDEIKALNLEIKNLSVSALS